MWKNSATTGELIDNMAQKDVVGSLWALNGLFNGGLQQEQFAAPQRLIEAISLSESGASILDEFLAANDDAAPEPAKLALFSLFYYHDLLVCPSKSDVETIAKCIGEAVASMSLRYPYIWGRLLYDRFNAQYRGNRTSHLPPAETSTFLSDTPQGVFQLGRFVTGPLGTMKSESRRFVPPMRTPGLWHCSDSGCMTLHDVQFEEHESDYTKVGKRLYEYLRNEYGRASEWSNPLDGLLRETGREPTAYCDLAPAIADALAPVELSSFLLYCMQSGHGRALRARLSSPPRSKRLGKGSAEDFVARLSLAAQVQLLFTLSDAALVEAIDDAALTCVIDIPPGETRTARKHPPKIRSADTYVQISRWGVRSPEEEGIVTLGSLIPDLYSRRQLHEQLAWRLNGASAADLEDATMTELRRSDPRRVVTDLVMSQREVAEEFADELGVPRERLQETGCVDHLLWKLGFDEPSFRDGYGRFVRRADELKEVALRVGEPSDEDEREEYRRAGVNLFVSVEEFLEELISFNTWYLFSDHFFDTRFMYRPIEAMGSVSTHLGSSLDLGHHTVTWDSRGHNTLGALLQYLDALQRRVGALSSLDRTGLTRPVEQMPHYSEDRFTKFPFLHLQFWADLPRQELARYCDCLERVVDPIRRSECASVRNGFDHKRGSRDFPTSESVLRFCQLIRSAFDAADLSRLLPKRYWVVAHGGTFHGKRNYSLQDYAGRTVRVNYPTRLSGLAAVTYDAPMLLAPNMPFGPAMGPVVFHVVEPSEYSSYWDGYPQRRRLRQQAATDDSEDEKTDEVPAPETAANAR